MRWWPFHRRKPPDRGDAAKKAKQEATRAIADACSRNADIRRELDVFADVLASEVQAAMAKRRQR